MAKKSAFCLAVILVISLGAGVPPRYLTPKDVTVELAADQTSATLYEPILLRYRMIYSAIPTDPELRNEERLARFATEYLNISGPIPDDYPRPFRIHFPYYFAVGAPTVLSASTDNAEIQAIHPGGVFNARFWYVPWKQMHPQTLQPGEFELWVDNGEDASPERDFKSNRLVLRVKSPSGQDLEALEFAKSPSLLCNAFMDRLIVRLKQDEAMKLFGKKSFGSEADWIALNEEFVRRFPDSCYHPFVLFNLCRRYFEGQARTHTEPNKKSKDGGIILIEPDYELLLSASDRFIAKYANHDLCDEAHFFRFVALKGLKKEKEAAEEACLVQKLYPKSVIVYAIRDIGDFMDGKRVEREHYPIIDGSQIRGKAPSSGELAKFYYTRWHAK